VETGVGIGTATKLLTIKNSRNQYTGTRKEIHPHRRASNNM
jgi:hypothetical protein